jgi:ABC-type transport system substrate-binding protein
VVQNNLQALGIAAQRIVVNWDIVYARALTPAPDAMGKNHTEGGFDALFFGFEVLDPSDPYTYYHSSQMSFEGGRNYYLWNNTQNDQLVEKIHTETNWTKRLDYLKQWQVFAYDELPSIAIYNSKELVIMDKHMNGTTFQKYYYPLWPNIELWQFDDLTNSATFAQPGLLMSLSAYHSTSYYDLGYSAPVYGEGAGYGLVRRGYDYGISDYMAYGNWTVSPDGRNWTFWVRPGIFFHNGEELDGIDVVATQRAVMTPAFASPRYFYASSRLGGNRSIYFAGEEGTPGAGLPFNKYEVHFDLPSAWAYFLQEFAASAIYPASVLLNGTYDFASQDYVDLQPNAGELSNFILTSFGAPTDLPYSYIMKNGSARMYFGPIGAGPYTYVGYNATSSTVHLQKNLNYFRKAALEAQGYLQLDDYYCSYVSGSALAFLRLEGGQVDVIDHHYNFRGVLMPFPSTLRYIMHEGLSVQELGFNMRHPIFGTGVKTPLGENNPSLAADAAMHVRRAIEYSVPKNSIIKIMLGYGPYLSGPYGSLGITTPVPRGTEGFNYDIAPRNETESNAQALAVQELRAAGYVIAPYGWPPSPEASYLVWLAIALGSSLPMLALVGYLTLRREKMQLGTS